MALDHISDRVSRRGGRGGLLPVVAIALTILPGCLVLPYLRTGPSEARIEGAASNERFLVKGRVPYLIAPPVARSAAQRLASGAILRAEARDHVHAVTIENDTGLELWLRTFDQAKDPAPVIACEDGEPSKLELPRAIPPGHDLTLLMRDGRRRKIDLILKTLVDREDIVIRFGNGPPLAAGFVIIPASLYSYHRLPVRCREAARE
jgi:hypothetical protein